MIDYKIKINGHCDPNDTLYVRDLVHNRMRIDLKNVYPLHVNKKHHEIMFSLPENQANANEFINNLYHLGESSSQNIRKVFNRISLEIVTM